MSGKHITDEGKFSVDLCQNAKAHIRFLSLVHASGTSLTTPSLESLRRYQDLWLPLVYDYPNEELAPPVDVAWLWHCHRLAPKQYGRYLKHKFGPECSILDAKAPFCLQSPDKNSSAVGSAANTCVLWNAKYPDESFFLSEKKSSKKSKKNKSKTTTALLASTERQAKFLWQVSGPKYDSIVFLKQGVEEYYKFLNLKNYAKDQQILVPTLQIDLMWHTHILSSLQAYREDCMAIMKTEFDHDDSIEETNLDEYFNDTNDLWKQHYGEDYFVEGGMNRGEPPKEFYTPEWAMSKVSTTIAAPSSVILWCWKESKSHIHQHDTSKIVGDPSDGWIQYGKETSNKLEQAYQGKQSICVPMDGYNVNFSTMKQTNVTTGYERDVQRFDIVWCWEETEGQISDPASLVGDPADRMVRYNKDANNDIETAFQFQRGTGTCLPLQGYVVDFDTMKQMKISTGFQRKVERIPIASNNHDSKRGEEDLVTSLSPNNTHTPFAVAVPAGDVISSRAVATPTTTTATTDGQGTKQTRNAICVFVAFCCCISVIVAVAISIGIIFSSSSDADIDVQSVPSPDDPTPAPTAIAGTTVPATTSPSGPQTIAPSANDTPSPTSGKPQDNKRWRCGYPPEDNDERDTPTCLRIKPKQENSDFVVFREPEGPLCMYGGEPSYKPPMWCYEDPLAGLYKSYYLWWSPCTRCGTAWRLDEDRDDDRSMFKSPSDDPGPGGIPGDSWYRWTGSAWSTDVDMEIIPCDPNECWVDDSGWPYMPSVQTSGGGNSGQTSGGGSSSSGSSSSNIRESSSSSSSSGFILIIVIIFVIGVIFVACIVCRGSESTGRTPHRSGGTTHTGGFFAGAACGGGGGGGGGGCGGGGGGCGGC